MRHLFPVQFCVLAKNVPFSVRRKRGPAPARHFSQRFQVRHVRLARSFCHPWPFLSRSGLFSSVQKVGYAAYQFRKCCVVRWKRSWLILRPRTDVLHMATHHRAFLATCSEEPKSFLVSGACSFLLVLAPFVYARFLQTPMPQDPKMVACSAAARVRGREVCWSRAGSTRRAKDSPGCKRPPL